MPKMSVYARGGKLGRFFRSARPAAHLPGAGRFLLVAVLLLMFSCLARAQDNFASGASPSGSSLPNALSPQVSGAAQPTASERLTVRNLTGTFLHDQAVIWSSPARIRSSNMPGLVTFFLATTLAMATDHQTMSTVVSHDPTFNNRNVDASNVLTGGFIGVPALIFLNGEFFHSPGARETGFLAGEAMANSMVVDEVLKFATMRERPTLDNAKGKFFQTSSATDSSFPSSHSLVAWSSAAVLASESNVPLIKFGAYTLATGVSLTRVLGQQHFPSDVLVGSVFGWMIGRYVYHKRHRDEGY
jgi:membrane-associated phospholipid phosphatase